MKRTFDLLFSPQKGHPLPDKTVLLERIPAPLRELFKVEEWAQITELLKKDVSTDADVLYRQELFRDLLRWPELADRLFQIGEQSHRLWTVAEKETDPEGAGPEAALQALQATVVSLMEHLKFLKQLRKVFRDEELSSQGLLELQDWLEQIADAPVFSELSREIAGIPLLSPETAQMELFLAVGPCGEICKADLNSIGSGSRKPRKSLFSDGEKEIVWLAPEQTRFATDALLNLNRKFQALTKAIRDTFTRLNTAASFYRAGMRLVREGEQRGLPICFALSTNGPLSALGVTDPACLKGTPLRQWDIRPLPLQLYAGPRAKTELNTAAVLLCLGSAGLPLLAKRAELPLTARPTVFSSPDRPRPEEEIPALSEMYYAAQKDETLFLDEPLRSLAETEGAELLKTLLQGLFRNGVWVFCATELPLT